MRRIVLATVLAALPVAAAFGASYQVDPRHSQVRFTYSHLGFANITGRFDALEGRIVYDPASPAASSVAMTVAIDSISTGVAALDDHLRRDDFFDAASHPSASFTSTAVEPAGEGRLRVTGDLGIRGITRQVVFDVTVNKVGTHPMRNVPAAGFDAVARIRRSDFGIDKHVPNIPDEVRIEVSVEALGGAGD